MAELIIKLVDGQLAGQTAQTLTKNYNEAALAAKKATIGTQEWVTAQQKVADAKGLLEANKNQIEATTKASTSLKQSFGGILDQIPGFTQIKTAMQGATSGVGGLTSGFGVLKGAIAATGIGLLVTAVSTLVMWFSKTEQGANTLAGVMRGLGNVVDFVFGKLISLAKIIGGAFVATFNAIKGPISSVLDFVKGVVTDMLKPFTVMYDFLVSKFPAVGKFFDSVKSSISGFVDEIVDAAKEGYEFVQMMDDLEDRQAAMEVTAKKTENAINQLLLQAKNVGKTYEERIALLDKADALTRKSYQDQLALSLEYQKAVNAEIDAEKKKQGVLDDTDEMRDKRKDAELKYLEIQGQGIELEEKIANRREQILGKKEKADEKAAADLQKRLDAEAKALEAENKVWEKIEDQKIEIMDESREKDLAHLQLSLQRQIEILDVNAPTYAAALASAQELARKQKDDINTKWDKTDAEKANKASDEQKKIALDKQKYETNLANVRLETEKGVVDGVGQLLVQGTKNEKDAKIIKRGFALADIGFNLGKELSANALAAAENPLNGLTFGAAGAAQLAASNLRSVLFAGINVAKVLAFRKGGFTGSGADDETAGIVHKNEYVIPAPITSNPAFAGIINTLEMARVSGYQIGGMVNSPVNPYSDKSRGPIASTTANQSSGSNLIDLHELAAIMDARIDTKIKLIKVQNVATETEGVLKTINKIKDDSNA